MIKSSATMVNVLHSSSWNMDPLLRPFFPGDTINNIIHFLTYIHESISYATGVRLYLYPNLTFEYTHQSNDDL